MTTTYRLVSLLRLASVAVFVLSSAISGRAADEVAPAPAAQDPDKRPVILLTGFAPFGSERPANPSWEGIKKLDGLEWRGRRLACRELRVDWGAPLEQLGGLIDELHPIAVLSFGQGSPAGFALETRARNERGQIPDNRGKLPEAPLIAADGPKEFKSSLDAKKLTAALAKQAFPIHASENAGQYLCEEALYSLELLKSQERVPGDVLFCHVPPLGARLGASTVDAAYVQSFVEALLAAWEDGQPAPKVGAGGARTLHQAAADAREKDVRALIDHYFVTWSAKDIDRYGQCFAPQAVIQLIDPDGKLSSMTLRNFLESQRAAHRNSAVDMTEAPESVEVRFEGKLARVVVHWKLVAGERIEVGYDHFTLMPVGGQWRIANLIFYESPPNK